MKSLFEKSIVSNARLSLGVSALFLAAASLPSTVGAHCGASACQTNLYWETQGVWAGPGTILDLSFQYIDQDRLIGGSHAAHGHGHGHGHTPERVITRKTTLRLSHGFGENWGIDASIPWINRRYEDRRFGHGGSRLDLTEFSELGDVRILGRYQFNSSDDDLTYGIRLGVALPTGDYKQRSAEGRNTDRRLQPGTGTTDLILSVFVNGILPLGNNAGWFGTIGVQEALGERENFAPGTEVTGDLGVQIPVLDSLDLLAQLNATWTDRDRGSRGFPRDSGGTILSASPGLRYWATESVALYGLVELPFYRDLNGEQLVNEWALTVGMGVRF